MLNGSEAPDGVRFGRDARTVRSPLAASYRISSRADVPDWASRVVYPVPSGSHVAWNDRASKSRASKIDVRRASVSGGIWAETPVGEAA